MKSVAVSDELMEAEAAEIAGLRNLSDARLTDFIADRLADGRWAGWGIKTPEHFLSWQFGVTPARAKVFTTMATRRGQLPETFAKFRAGLLSADQVSLLCRHCPPEYDRSASEFAVHATLPQLSRTLRNYSWPEPHAPEPNDDHRKQVSMTNNDRGDFTLRVTASTEEGERVRAVVAQYWAKLADQRPESDEEPVTDHEAFMAMIDSAADADLSTSRRDRHRTLLHVDVNHFVELAAGGADEPERPGAAGARFHLGPVVDAETMRLLTCDDAVQVVLSKFGSPLRLGRSRRTIPLRLRELVIQRDHGCRICGTRRNLDVHHLVHWSQGGPTDPSNLVTLCSRHHTMLHNGHFHLSGSPEGALDLLVVTDEVGRVVSPPCPRAPVLRPFARYNHPLGERLNPRDVHFNPEDPPGPPVPRTHPQLE